VPRPLLFRSRHYADGYVYIESAEGAAQGDPFAGFAYNFTIHPVPVSLFGPKDKDADKIFYIAFADDITTAPLVWPQHDVFHNAFNDLVEALGKIGSVVSTSKTVICSLGPTPVYGRGRPEPPTLPNPAGKGTPIPVKVNYVVWLCLGAPIGADTPRGVPSSPNTIRRSLATR
jgi:hypothetical protein